MKNLKSIILLSFAGAIICFSFWPVLSGTDHSKSCEKNADCGFPEKKSARIIYLFSGQKFNDPNLTSRSDYCSITGTCLSETIAIPLSIFMGSGAGMAVGAMLSWKKLRKSKSWFVAKL